jgi:hypothetical protein
MPFHSTSKNVTKMLVLARVHTCCPSAAAAESVLQASRAVDGASGSEGTLWRSEGTLWGCEGTLTTPDSAPLLCMSLLGTCNTRGSGNLPVNL